MLYTLPYSDPRVGCWFMFLDVLLIRMMISINPTFVDKSKGCIVVYT
jgi:hypothetical protein